MSISKKCEIDQNWLRTAYLIE